MHRKVLIGALAVLGLLVMAAPATAARRPHRYSPRHGAKCRKHYKRIRHGRHVYCVRRHVKMSPIVPPTPPTTTQQVRLHAHLDPSYTRNPLDPFEVTYAYSASATSQTFSAMATPVGTEAPAPLPAGVLSFYSDGTLECAINVGSGVEGSECPVTYKALGEHRVTTIYSSGEQSATATEAEDITPLATTTTLSVAYEAEPYAVQEEFGGEGHTRIGTLRIDARVAPGGPAGLRLCRGAICAVIGNELPVYGVTSYLDGERHVESIKVGGNSLSLLQAEEGVLEVQSAFSGAGYSPSAAAAIVRFDPVAHFASIGASFIEEIHEEVEPKVWHLGTLVLRSDPVSLTTEYGQTSSAGLSLPVYARHNQWCEGEHGEWGSQLLLGNNRYAFIEEEAPYRGTFAMWFYGSEGAIEARSQIRISPGWLPPCQVSP